MAEAGDGKGRSSRRRTQHQLYKRVTDDELTAFKQRAAQAGFASHQEYLTALIHGDAGFDRRDRQELVRILGELGKQGSNLNQLSYAVNGGRLTVLSANDIRIIEDVRTVVQELGAEIREALK